MTSEFLNPTGRAHPCSPPTWPRWCACTGCATGSSTATSRSSMSSAGPTSRSAATGRSAGTGSWCAARSRLGVAPLQGLADLGSWRSGGMGGDPPARVQGGRQPWAWCRATGSSGTRRHGCGWDGLPGQERPDSAQRITTAAMPVSAILSSTGNFSPPALRRLPATRSLSAGWWCLPAAGWERSGPHAPRPVEQRHPDPPPNR
jgi:hypothetical protein